MKIAVLISGEYRTFKQCRPNMTFLDDTHVDVYFSTWSTSHQVNKLLGVDDYQDINYETVVGDLGFHPVACSIDTQPETYSVRKMILRWQAGIQLIEASGIEYDYLLVTRPDLYFSPENMFSLYTHAPNNDSLLSLWQQKKGTGFISDCFYYAKFTKLATAISEIDEALLEGYVHSVLYAHLVKYLIILEEGEFNFPETFLCRPNIKTTSVNPIYSHVWFNSQYIEMLGTDACDGHMRDIIYNAVGDYYLGLWDEYL